MRRTSAALMVLALAIGGCGASDADRPDRRTVSQAAAYDYQSPPSARDAPAPRAVTANAQAVVRSLLAGSLDGDALRRVVASGDARQAWLLADLLRFVQDEGEERALVDAFARLTGRDPREDPAFGDSAWSSVTNHLIAWDTPAPPGYVAVKAMLFTAIEPAWRAFFADRDADIDWRLVSWGGVPIDARPAGATAPCPRGCIPALDDPKLTSAREGGWHRDDAIVFGVVVGGQAVAFPRNIMEVHKMVNVTIAGRRLGIPYCTLCASAQAYFTDRLPGGRQPAVLRTSGLLSRSNKVMYELRRSWTRSPAAQYRGRYTTRASRCDRPRSPRAVGAHGSARTPGRGSSRVTAGSAASTRPIRCAAATTTARSSRSGPQIFGCRCRNG